MKFHIYLTILILSGCSGGALTNSAVQEDRAALDTGLGIDIALDDGADTFETAAEPVPVSGTNLALLSGERRVQVFFYKLDSGTFAHYSSTSTSLTRLTIDIPKNSYSMIVFGNHYAIAPPLTDEEVDGQRAAIRLDTLSSAMAVIGHQIFQQAEGKSLFKERWLDFLLI